MIKLLVTEKQKEIINCTAQVMGVFAGRRWGKTDTFFNRCVKKCLEHKIEYLYVAPSFSLAKEQFERIVGSLGSLVRRAILQPHPRIELINGSRIHFRSFDKPKYLKGMRRIAEIWVDEIQDIKESGFWTVLKPMLSDTSGTLIVSGQFAGHNWYYDKIYLPGQQPDQSTYKSWKLPSSTGLVFQSERGKRDLEHSRAIMPRAEFLQQYECEPLANVAAVFMPEDLAVIKRGEVKQQPDSNCRYIVAYDLGEISDPSAEVVLEYETRTIVSATQIPLRTKHEVQSVRLATTARRWNNAQVVIDGTAGGTGGHKRADEITRYYKDTVPNIKIMIWQQSVKYDLVHRARLAVEKHKISIPKELEELHKQLANYEYKKKGDGVIYHGRDGLHDDLVAAFMMAVYAYVEGWTRNGNGGGLARLLS